MPKPSWLFLGFLLLLGPAPTEGRTPPKRDRVERLRTNAAVEALGIDTPAPRLSWALASERRGVMQSAYRVTVGSRPELSREGEGDVWDSGKVETSDPFATYAGPKLRSRTRYYWSVRVWASGGFAADASPVTWFETAFFDPSEWRGQWIAGPERRTTALTTAEGEADDAEIRAKGELCRPVGWITSGFSARNKNDQGECRELRPAPLLRKSFRVTKPIAHARVYTSGLAYNLLTINGRPASNAVLDPGFTNYSKTVLYTTLDVTGLLRRGENVVATELGSGRFDDAARSWDWGWDAAEWRATPRLRLDLYVTYTDGAEDLVSSDASWRVSTDGPHRYDSLYLGETYDARREIPRWNRAGFDDSRWAAARIVEAPAGRSRAQGHQPIRIVDSRAPGVRSQPSPGVVVYDVGQNLTGWAEIEVHAAAGTAVEVFYSEKLDQVGRASADGNALVYGQLQTDEYVAKGAGMEVWTPSFSYKGFQYVQISGPGGQPLPGDASVTIGRIHQVRSDLPGTSRFESSQETLDRIHRNTAWAIQSNLFGIVTDTPVYEKNAWTGDAALTAGTASLLFDTERLYRKMFQDMRDAQTAEGELSLLCPSNRNYGYLGKPFFKPTDCCGATPAWDAFWFVIPWESYRRYGDATALEAVYPVMQRYLDAWIPRWTDKDGDAFPHTLTSGLGDWLPPEGVPTLNALVSTAYYAHLVRIASEAARVLGRAGDAARYEDLFGKIRSDFNARFLGPAGFYREKDGERFTESAQILPLAFGLVPEERREALVTRLAGDITGVRGGNPYVGVLGARYILPVLTEAGRHDLAFTVATQTDEPSWGYWTDVAGFTALGESWPATTRSRNHHFFGAIVQWFYEELAGIRPLEPGYRRIEVRPEIPGAGLDRVAASYESVRGEIASAWRRTAAGLELDVTIPANATARVVVPAENANEVCEVASGRALLAETAPSVRWISTSEGRVVYDVGSGRYQFRVARPASSAAPASSGWPAYGGGPESIRYSTLDQIHRGNVRQLQVAWTYDSKETGGLQTNPIVVDGVLYTTTPKHRVVALDAATGQERWVFDSGIPGRGPNRGVTYWSSGDDVRIFAAQDQFLYALDARTGKVVPTFGRNGRIDLREDLGRPPEEQSVRLTTPAILYKELLIVGGRVGEGLPASPGYVRAYEARTGKLRWVFHTIPQPGEAGYETWPKEAWTYTGGANNWAGMAVDERRGIVYVPTGSAAADFYGANRLGDNLYANSLLALDAATGKRLWHFQAVRHDLWDRDFPAPPSLVTVTRGGRRIDAVAQTTKHGYLFLFDRTNGTPLFPIEEIKVPPSTVDGEVAADTQPLPTRPPPFARQHLTEDLLTRRTKEANRAVLESFRAMRNDGPFTPLSVGKDTIVFPGFDGGAEWGGSAFDPDTGLLYVNASEMAWTGSLAPNVAGTGGRALYLRHCASCHRDNLSGAPPQLPSLVGVTQRRSVGEITQIIRQGSGRMAGSPTLAADEVAAIIGFLKTGADRDAEHASPSPLSLEYRFTGYHKFLDPDGYPAIAPPWGTLTAIDLESGAHAWQVPLGEYPALAAAGLTNTGSENYGGPIVTKGGLVFIGATSYDKKFRAFDKATGALLWEATLPFSATGTPATYAAGGRQFVVVPAGGGKDGGPSGGIYVAFALPSPLTR